jgi:predicted enzyme related to lactoylglutathione lyase
MSGHVTHIAHVTVHTAMLRETVAFYQWLLGLPVAVELQTAEGEIVFLGANETKFELIEDKNAGKISASELSIGFAVEDIRAKIAMLDEKGIPHSPIISPAPKTKFIFFTDLNGCKIQLCEEAG